MDRRKRRKDTRTARPGAGYNQPYLTAFRTWFQEASPRMSLVRPLLVLALLLGLGAPARADGVAVAVLGLDAVDVPLEEAQALTDALRRRLASAPGIRLV